jgi:hypothetical protein
LVALTALLLAPTPPVRAQGTAPAGSVFELQSKDGGTAYDSSRSGSSPISDPGTWKVEGSSVCVAWRKRPDSCNEVREKDGQLYYTRQSDGALVVLTPH